MGQRPFQAGTGHTEIPGRPDRTAFPGLNNGMCGVRPDARDMEEIGKRCGVGIDRFPATGKEGFGVVVFERATIVEQGQQFRFVKTVTRG